MSIISWIVFGLIIGFIANLIQPYKARGGMLGTLVLGVLGSLLGGFLGTLFFASEVSVFNLPSFIIAIIGALVILFADRFLSKSA